MFEFKSLNLTSVTLMEKYSNNLSVDTGPCECSRVHSDVSGSCYTQLETLLGLYSSVEINICSSSTQVGIVMDTEYHSDINGLLSVGLGN